MLSNIHRRLGLMWLTLALMGLFGLAVLAPGGAAADAASAVTQSYSATGSVLPGMFVELAPKSQTTVTPLAGKDIKSMLGVVVPVNDAPIVLSAPSVTGQQVLVATSGRYNVLVSNQNGPVSSGDYLTMSALSGIAMKADGSQTQVVAQAEGAFNGSTNVLGSVQLKGSLGTTKVSIGSVTAAVRLAANPLYQGNNKLPRLLSKAASGVANKTVSPIRVYLSITVLGIVLFIFGSMLYSGVRNGVLAIGRNPLAKKSIGRGLIQTFIAGLIIFIVGMFAAYLILI